MLVRRLKGEWHLAAIRPGGKKVWALPKGIIGRGESAADAAVREVSEETGIQGRLLEKLGDVRYVYMWRGERVFKVVSFFLLRYSSGRLGHISPEHRREVDETRWIKLDEASGALAYRGEREMAEKALQICTGDGL